MLKKNTLATVLLAGLAAASGLTGWLSSPESSERPPLAGVFADNFTLLDEPVPAPQAELLDEAGERLTLVEFEGKVVLLNFWATWCGPCVQEMPSLDRLQAALGAAGLAVVAVSEDRGGLNVVAPFFTEQGLENLAIYLDPKGKFMREFAVRGLPTTMLIDRSGRLIGALEGPAEWDGPDAQALIRFYLEQPPPGGLPKEAPEGAESPVQTGG